MDMGEGPTAPLVEQLTAHEAQTARDGTSDGTRQLEI